MTWKRWLKQIELFRAANARYKCWRLKHGYDALCKQYGTPSIRRDPAGIEALTRRKWDEVRGVTSTSEKRRRVVFIGTDYEQDRSGALQAFGALTDLHVFEWAPGKYGHRWPTRRSECDEVRHHNARVLREMVDRLGGVDMIVGQMWGVSMHWRTIADMRERGIAVVSIAMDDRHAWIYGTMPDGTPIGTKGIAPYVTLGCTDAAECVAWYEAEGSRAIFFPEASDPALFAPGDGTKEFDVSFVGASYGVRGEIVGRLERAGVRVQAYGNGWPAGRIPTDDVPRLFARSKIVLGSGTVGHCDDFVALKLRDFDAPMSGSLYLTHDNPDFPALFEVGRELATFHTIDEAVDRARHYLASDAEREAIAAAGRARCLAEHTWEARVRLLLALV